MLGIAIQYGIKLEDLLAANPAVDPRLMSVDTLLVIPLPGITGEPTPTPTPLPLSLASPVCYRAAGQGWYCITEITNPLNQAVESLSAWLGLLSGGEMLASQVVVPGLISCVVGSVSRCWRTSLAPWMLMSPREWSC